MAVVIKKDEKINATISMLTDNFSQQDFIDKFKELYPKDWAKLEKAYADHMRHAKLGKPVPMPEPEQYLKNALNVWKKQNKNQMKDNSDTIHILPIDNISEVGIDDKQRLYVRPEKQTFEYIYRAAAEVGWDNKEKFLFSPKPKEWAYFDWYRQIIMATKGEYGCKLVLTDQTQWTNISDELKSQICRE